MGKATAPTTTGETVTIALKHPTGMIITAYEKYDFDEQTMSGTRKAHAYRPVGKSYTLNGTRVPFGAIPDFTRKDGYAYTPGIPKDVWENWLSFNKQSAIVVNGLIKAHQDLDWLADETKEGKDLRHGLEPLAQRDDSRTDKKRRRDGQLVDAIVTADEQPTTKAA